MRIWFCCLLLSCALSSALSSTRSSARSSALPSPAQDHARPEKVGRFGNPHAIQIEGAETFAPDEIREALLRSSAFVLGSHPGAPFDGFLKTVEGCLVRGYRSRGFPEPKVEVDWRAEDAALVARIVEGPRYKAGSVRVVGARAMPEDKIRWWLIDEEREGEQLELDDRGERTFKRIARKKELAPEVAQMMLGAGVPIPGNVQVLGSSEDDDLAAPWSTGSWVNFSHLGMDGIRAVVARAYMEEGYQFCEFEADYEDGKTRGVKNLLVTVLDESPLSLLGEVILKGNAINTDEEIMRFLGLEKGMELKGPYEVELRRRLWDSGRFLGWNIMSWRAPDEAVVNLTICLAEHWEAPPLSSPLTREQKSLMKFARWINSYDGRDGDLVVSVEDRTTGRGKIELALNQVGGMLLKAEAQGLGFFLESLSGNRVRAFLWGNEGGFHAAVPANETKAMAYASFTQYFHPADVSPGDCGGNVGAGRFNRASASMGMGIASSIDRSTTDIGMDPVLVFRSTGSHSGSGDISFEGGIVAVTDEFMVVRFEEETGRLIWAESLGEDESFRLALVPGRMEQLRREFDEAAAGVSNAMDGQSGWAMLLGFFGLAHEVMIDPAMAGAPEEPGEFFGNVSNATRRARKWLPVACAVDDVFASVFSNDHQDEEDEENSFVIPIDPEQLMGMNWMAMMVVGFYGELAKMVEPGSWPDLVLREMLFSLQGDFQYMEETVDALYQDESMGPLGSLLCARLLKRTGHPAARRFVDKARGELSAEGFAKDWKLALRGTADREMGAWLAIKQLGALRDADLNPLLAEASPDFRNALKDVLAACRTIGKDADAEALAPVMDALWEHGLGKIVTTTIDSAAEKLTPKVDPAKVALVVNGIPIPRVAEQMRDLMGLPGIYENFEDDWTARVLFAHQIWLRGMSMPSAQIAAVRKTFLGGIGGGDAAEGWKKVKAEGIDEEQLDWMLGTIMASMAYSRELEQKGEIEEAEVRAFYDKHPDLFRAGIETHVHRIMIPKKGEGLDPVEQVKLAERIHARLKLVADPKNLQKAFREEAKAHSVGSAAENGGCLQWIVPEDWFNEKLARAIALVPDKGLSAVIDEGQFLYIIHLPSNRREGKPRPFENVAAQARRRALLERTAEGLRKKADIVRIDPPAPGEVFEEPEPNEEAPGMAEKLQEMLGSGGVPEDKDKEERFGGGREDLPMVRKKALGGDALFVYYLGTYHERGVGMPRDLAAAHKRYEQAAAGGESKAMRRLAHLYFTGQGVERDEQKSREWRQKAAAESLKTEH